jgi:hypothetical protein
MAIFSRARTAAGAGTLAILVLVLAFGNQAYTEWAARHAQGANAWDLFLRTLAWPTWSLSGGRTALAHDLRAVLLVLFVAAVLGISAAALASGAGSFFIGWFAVILGGAGRGVAHRVHRRRRHALQRPARSRIRSRVRVTGRLDRRDRHQRRPWSRRRSLMTLNPQAHLR